MSNRFLEKSLLGIRWDVELFYAMPLQIRIQAVCALFSFYLVAAVLIFLVIQHLRVITFAFGFVLLFLLVFTCCLSLRDIAVILSKTCRKYQDVLLGLGVLLSILITAHTLNSANRRPLQEVHQDFLWLCLLGIVALVGGLLLFVRVSRVIYSEKIRVETEVRLVRSIQERLVPALDLRQPLFHLSGKTMMAGEVGGDFFEASCQDGKTLDVAVGDVSGHNITAGFLMAVVQTAFRSELRHGRTLGEIVAELNQTVLANGPRQMFVTFLYARFKFPEQTLSLLNAGHPPLLMHSRHSAEIKALVTGHQALGIDQDAVYLPREIPFANGDLFLFYSDGLAEARNAAGEEFGQARLAALLKENCAEADAALIQQRISGAVQAFTGQERIKDDGTLVVVRVIGAKS